MTSLRLALTLLWLSLAQGEQRGAVCDLQRQYSYTGLCCDFCPPGYFVQKHCTATDRTVCVPCSSGTFSEVADKLDDCRKCTTCQQVTLTECSATFDANCSCHEGFLCTTLECENCQKKEICPRGHELTKTGAYTYEYDCEPCADGLYSDTEGGVCEPLTRCEQLGQATIFPGNKTHNSACRIPDPAREAYQASGNTEVILVVILLLCVFICLVVLVKTCASKAVCRKQKKLMTSMKASPSTTVDLSDESLGFQLSKEERGDHPIQEIDKKASLTSLSDTSGPDLKQED